MDKHETKARVEAQMNEWKRNLDTMKAKVEASGGDVKVKHAETVGHLQQQLDEMKIKAAVAWDSADDTWDSKAKDLDHTWQDWQGRAKAAWVDLSK